MGAKGSQNPDLDFDALYAQAEEARPLLESFGQNILTDIRQRFPGKFDDAYLDIAQLKAKGAANDKIAIDYKGDVSRITDLTRGRIVTQTREQADLLRQYMAEQRTGFNLQDLKITLRFPPKQVSVTY